MAEPPRPAPSTDPRPAARPGHVVLLGITLFSLGTIGAVFGLASFVGASSTSLGISMFALATFAFDTSEIGLVLGGFGAVSAIVGVVFLWRTAWHLAAAATFVGWAAVSIWLSSAPAETRMLTAAAMIVAACATLAARRSEASLVLSARRSTRL